MKDPLQTSETPYEVLGIEPGLSDEDLRKAYFEAIRKRVPAAKATEAYNTLRRPVERARIALTQYDVNALKQLNPCPIDGDPALQVSHRAATAKAWENRLKETFPEAGTIHSLAVLWYWWTQHEEQRYSLIVDAVRDPKSLARGRTGKHSLLRSIARSNGCDCDPENRRNCPHADCPWREDCRSPAPPLEQMWQKVIACWCALALTPDFWTALGGLTTPQAEELSGSFLDSLHGQILDRAQRYAGRLYAGDQGSSDAGAATIRWGWAGMTEVLQSALARKGITTIGAILRASEETLTSIKGIDEAKAAEIKEYARKVRRRNADLPEEYRMLAQLLRTEQRTAEAVTEVGVKRRNGGDVRCGVLMLTHLGYLDSVKNALEAKLIYVQGNPRLESLKQHLSRQVHIVLLLDEKKAETALEAMECLPDDERGSDEVRDLRARAHDIMAQQKVSVERYEDALDCWGEALRLVSSASMAEEIHARVVSSCKAPVASLQRSQPDKIIAILEKALTIVSDRDLDLIMGDTLAIQALSQLNAANGQLQETGMTRELLSRIEKAAADLEKAAMLGSKMAQDNLVNIRQFVESARNGMLSLPLEALRCVTRGNEAAQRQQWGEAIRCFREAVEKVGADAPDELKKGLAGCLANDAVNEINRAMASYTQALQRHDQEVEGFLNIAVRGLFAANANPFYQHDRGSSCAHCGCGGSSGFVRTYEQQQWAEFNHPQHGRLKLCQSCAAKLQAILNRRPRPSQDVINVLQSVARELYEAVYLDPSGPYPTKSLGDLRTLASNLNITLPSQPQWRPPKPAKKPPVAAQSQREGRAVPQNKEPPKTTPGTPQREGRTGPEPKEPPKTASRAARPPGQETDAAFYIGIFAFILVAVIVFLAIVWVTLHQ